MDKLRCWSELGHNQSGFAATLKYTKVLIFLCSFKKLYTTVSFTLLVYFYGNALIFLLKVLKAALELLLLAPATVCSYR